MDKEFKKWMKWYGKKFRPYSLEIGDFLEDQWSEKIASSTSVKIILLLNFFAVINVKVDCVCYMHAHAQSILQLFVADHAVRRKVKYQKCFEHECYVLFFDIKLSLNFLIIFAYFEKAWTRGAHCTTFLLLPVLLQT